MRAFTLCCVAALRGSSLLVWLALHAMTWHAAGASSAPERGFWTLEQAACGCLERAWSVDTRREIAGGIVVRAGPVGAMRFACSPLTRGAASRVTFRIARGWLGSFHTHPRGAYGTGEHLSPNDTRIARSLDPLQRPLFVRTPRGRVLEYRAGRTRRIPCWRLLPRR